MLTSKPSDKSNRFLSQLLNAGITTEDDEEGRLNKSLLMLATGLFTLMSMLWPAIYNALGQSYSTTLPLTFQLLLIGNMLWFIKTNNFPFFRTTQLSFFLFLPFVTQWVIGNFIASSGIILWALIAPIGALLCIGASESVGWFIAWATLTAITGGLDYYLADPAFTLTGNNIVPVRTSLVFFVLNFIAVAASIYLLLRFSIIEKRKAQAKTLETYADLLKEQERAENLLLNILPAPIADRLRNNDQTIADGFADVTVMFADIVNFTQLAESLSPNQVFTTLNRIFSTFDELAEKYDLEKIKTIGDAYMVAGGLDSTNQNYTIAMADMAIEMNTILLNNQNINPLQLGIRIGIGTGPLIAGVVGKKKFIYDLWGDTVNIASRITSESHPGMIHCDSTTYRRLSKEFKFEGPSLVQLKGKGNTEIYKLVTRS